MEAPLHEAPIAAERPADLDRWPAMGRPRPAPARAAIARVLLRKVARQTGIRVALPDGTSFGAPSGPTMRIVRPDAFFDRVGRSGKIGFGEAYMAGDWVAVGDLADLLTPMAANMRTLVPPSLQWIRRFYEPRPPRSEDNDPTGSRRNISRHYDLSNDLFSLFLDPSMTYSSALFLDPAEPLELAQSRKIERLLDGARVGPGSRVLEIGTGWGELARQAARRGAQVTTLTLSTEQAELARTRLAAEGLDERVEVMIRDYRHSSGRFDAILSVEMIEAVGERWWPTYFRTLEDRLAPGGRIGIQSILMRHDGMIAARSSWTWIHKYIFPGGIIPSLPAIDKTLADHTSLRVMQRHHFGSSYAETLKQWRDRFMAEEPAVDALGFDAVFRRMWEFYLAYSEAGFRSGYLDVAQLILGRGEGR
ncbi:MAG TPA: cyclopropane-fatty-acyl-phospholipid synthase family protein [Acidimicrobiales bacterium]|jgi:cyclopropane-fatty-acyl-phospholipid synthase|nr:cyclopropane-fatty-acyl-phospholipid synthase family protein [Acidimicrobiales bacterium]